MYKIAVVLVFLGATVFALLEDSIIAWIFAMMVGGLCVALPAWILEFVVLAVRRKPF